LNRMEIENSEDVNILYLLILEIRAGKRQRYNCKILFVNDGTSTHQNNVRKLEEKFHNSGLNFICISAEEARRKLQKQNSHKQIGYKGATIFFYDKDKKHLLVILPGEPGIEWIRNDPLTKDMRFRILYIQIPEYPLSYLSEEPSYVYGPFVTTTSEEKKALTFHCKIKREGADVLKSSDVIQLCIEDGRCLEAFWNGLYLVLENASSGWKVIADHEEVHIDDLVTLVSLKYPEQKLNLQKGSLTTAKTDSYWRLCYIDK